MQFTTLTLLTLAAVAAAVAVPGRGGSSSIEDAAIKNFTEECKSQDKIVICCSKTSTGASEGDCTGYLNGADVTCSSVPSYVSAGMLSSITRGGSGLMGDI